MNKLPLPNPDEISFFESQELFRRFSTKSQDCGSIPPQVAENQDFGRDFPGGLIYKPHYKKCRFYKSSFISSNGGFSCFEDSQFYDCTIDNADFNYISLENCLLEGKTIFNVFNSGFNFGAFSKTIIKKISFRGIAFRDMFIEDCVFEDCSINNSSFERTTLKNVFFKNIDFRNVGIRYNLFENVQFENVVFPILDIVNNIGLFKILEEQQSNIMFSVGYDEVVSFEEAKELSLLLIPYYLNTNQFFPVLNTYLLNENLNDIGNILPRAFEESIKNNDFDTLQNICQLISNSGYYNKKQLREFYYSITNIINPNSFSYNLKRGYAIYMDRIKAFLVDNPEGLPYAQIRLSTSIDYSTLNQLPVVIKDIEDAIASVNGIGNSSIQLTHNSPYEVLVTIYGILPDLLMMCQMFYYAFGGIKALHEIKKSRHEKAKNNSHITKNKSSEKEVNSTMELSLGKIHFRKETKTVIKEIEYNIH